MNYSLSPDLCVDADVVTSVCSHTESVSILY